MSRNIRPKVRKPAKELKRRGSDSSSSLHLSSDEGYSGVDDVSDSSDDDEEDVDAAEEEHIISHELRKGATHGSPRPSDDLDQDADEEEDEDEEDGDSQEEEEDDDDDEDAEESTSWDGIVDESAPSDRLDSSQEVSADSTSVERHVRFAGVPDSDSDSTASDATEEVAGFFPDIFVEQTALDPAFRREIEEDPDDMSNSSSNWDFSASFGYAADSDGDIDDIFEVGNHGSSQESGAGRAENELSNPTVQAEESPIMELDGYETDGDTTEEDVPELVVRKKQPGRRPHSASYSSESETDRPARSRKGHPRAAPFDLDSPEKPIAVLNPITRKMMIFTPQRLRRLDLSPESFNLQFFADANAAQSSPIRNNTASFMMNAMFPANTFGDFMNAQSLVNSGSFFPLPSDATAGYDSDESFADEEEDDAEKNLQIEDFITFQGHSSDEGEGDAVEDCDDGDDWDNGNGGAATPTRRPSTAASSASTPTVEVHPLFTHFDCNVDVGAFRREQLQKQMVLSDRATYESLAFSGPLHIGTLRGIKTGRLETVTTPISPVRRKKRNSLGGGEMSWSPPDSTPQKRKAGSATSEVAAHGHSHKKQRSISDVEAMRLA